MPTETEDFVDIEEREILGAFESAPEVVPAQEDLFENVVEASREELEEEFFDPSQQAVVEEKGGFGSDWALTYVGDREHKFNGVELQDAVGNSLTQVIEQSMRERAPDKVFAHQQFLEHLRTHPGEQFVLPDWKEYIDGGEILHVTVATMDREGYVSYETWSHTRMTAEAEEPSFGFADPDPYGGRDYTFEEDRYDSSAIESVQEAALEAESTEAAPVDIENPTEDDVVREIAKLEVQPTFFAETLPAVNAETTTVAEPTVPLESDPRKEEAPSHVEQRPLTLEQEEPAQAVLASHAPQEKETADIQAFLDAEPLEFFTDAKTEHATDPPQPKETPNAVENEMRVTSPETTPRDAETHVEVSEIEEVSVDVPFESAASIVPEAIELAPVTATQEIARPIKIGKEIEIRFDAPHNDVAETDAIVAQETPTQPVLNETARVARGEERVEARVLEPIVRERTVEVPRTYVQKKTEESVAERREESPSVLAKEHVVSRALPTVSREHREQPVSETTRGRKTPDVRREATLLPGAEIVKRSLGIDSRGPQLVYEGERHASTLRGVRFSSQSSSDNSRTESAVRAQKLKGIVLKRV